MRVLTSSRRRSPAGGLSSDAFSEAFHRFIAVDFVISDEFGDGSCLRLLDHDRTGHLRMNRAKVSVSPRYARRDDKFLVGVERGGFLKLLLDAHDRVRFLVPINPGYFFPRLHRQSLRSEVEILNHYLVLFGAFPRRFLLGLAEGKMGQD